MAAQNRANPSRWKEVAVENNEVKALILAGNHSKWMEEHTRNRETIQALSHALEYGRLFIESQPDGREL